MFNNIKENTKELGLAERTQPSATEIYTTKGIPTGSVMPEYTHTQTRKKIEFSPSEQRKRDTALRHLIGTTPEERRILFESFQEKYENEIYHHITDLMLWASTTEHLQDKALSIADYDLRIRGELKKLTAMDATLPVDSYFRNGSDDTAKCGHLLIIKMTVWDEVQQIYAIELLSGIQWLMQEKEKLISTLKDINPSGNPVLEDAFKDLLHHYMNMKDNTSKVTFEGKTFRRDNVIIGLMHYSVDKKVIQSKHLPAFISLIAPILKISDNQIDNIRRTCTNDETELSSYQCELKDLELHHIKKQNPCAEEKNVEKLFRKWDGLYEAIDTAAQKSELFMKLIPEKENEE